MENKKIYEVMGKIKEELLAISKDKKATGFGAGYSFRGIDQVYNFTHQLFGKYKIHCQTEILNTRETEHKSNKGTLGFRVVRDFKFKFYTEDGSFTETCATGEAIDFGDKAYNKCHSIAHKYALLTMLCIPTEDMEDPDKEVHEPTTAKKPSSNNAAPKPPQRKNSSKGQKKPALKDQVAEFYKMTVNLLKHNGQGPELLKELMMNKFGHAKVDLLGVQDAQTLWNYAQDVINEQ